MSCGLWLAIFPMLLICCGAVRIPPLPLTTSSSTSRSSCRFCILAVLSFIPAILYVYLTLPIFSCAKGSYLLGILPCIAIPDRQPRFEPLARHRAIQAAAFGLIFTWAIDAYLTVFHRHDPMTDLTSQLSPS